VNFLDESLLVLRGMSFLAHWAGGPGRVHFDGRDDFSRGKTLSSSGKIFHHKYLLCDPNAEKNPHSSCQKFK
jgi:hypothetical protein